MVYRAAYLGDAFFKHDHSITEVVLVTLDWNFKQK